MVPTAPRALDRRGSRRYREVAEPVPQLPRRGSMTREEHVAFFREHGYLAVENVFSADEVDRLRANLEAFERRTHSLAESTDRVKLTLFGGAVEDRAIQQIAEPHELDGDWMDLAADPRILDLVEGLIGPNILLYYSM